MFKNYLATALGNLKRHKFTTVVNLLGLAICLGTFVLIALFVRYELSYDKHHPDADRIYRITETIDAGSYVENSSSAPFPVLPNLMLDYPEMIESGVRLFDMQLPVKSFKLEDERLFNETGIFFADSNFFQFFNMPLLRGDANTALDRPKTIAISEELAEKYFGNTDPVGKFLFLGGFDQMNLEITGVYKAGGPTHIQPRAIISFSTYMGMNQNAMQNWVWNPCWSYIKLAPNVSPESLSARFPEFVQAHYIDRVKDMVSHQLQPISSIHLHSQLEFEMGPNSSMRYIFIMISAAVFLLLVGSINYINLSTIGYFARTRELGVRKVLGAFPKQIRLQILLESVVLTLLACLMGLAILLLFLKPFSNSIQVSFNLTDFLHWPSLVTLILFLILIGMLAGAYPALKFSNISVLSVLRSNATGEGSNNWVRNGLVVLQFSLSIILIIFSLSARRQLNYMYEKDKGFNDENVLLFKITGTQIPGTLKSFRSEMMKHPSVEGVTVMNEILGVNNNNHEYNYEGLPAGQWHYFPALMVDEEFTDVFDMELLAGRTYDATKQKEDSLSVVVNEAMVKFLGYTDPQEALNKRMNSLSGSEKIVGVVRDFHFKSLHNPIVPMVMDIETRRGNFFYFAKLAAVKVSSLNQEVLDHMEGVWQKAAGHHPFDYRLLSNEIKQLYKTENRMTVLLDFFTLISVVVALMGLFALSRFMAYFKTKEIAIRKVFGAETPQLLLFASKEQFWLVIISLLIALPVAYLAVDYWLQSFSYRIDQNAFIYIMAAFAALVLSMLTVMLVSLKAIRTNTSKVLQYE